MDRVLATSHRSHHQPADWDLATLSESATEPQHTGATLVDQSLVRSSSAPLVAPPPAQISTNSAVVEKVSSAASRVQHLADPEWGYLMDNLHVCSRTQKGGLRKAADDGRGGAGVALQSLPPLASGDRKPLAFAHNLF